VQRSDFDEIGERYKPVEQSGNLFTWRLVNPEAHFRGEGKRVNPRPSDLSGKTVVLYWNGKPNGDVLLDQVGTLLVEKIPTVTIVKAWEVTPSTRITDPNDDASKAVSAAVADLAPDVVIGAAGDCTGSSTWLITDLLNMEKLGIPTVTLITSPFSDVVSSTGRAEGFHNACFVCLTPPLGMVAEEEIKEKACRSFGLIMEAVTGREPAEQEQATSSGTDASPYPADVIEFKGTACDLNDYFRQRQWSLGLPVNPPTPEKVRAMLKGTSRAPSEVLGQVPPNSGILTVELVAVYAAMAGCSPEFMPVIIGALDAFLAPAANWRLALSGTGTSQMMVIVSGPIVKQIGLAYGQGAAGKGHHANGSIGYALNLIAYGVGGSRPPSMDRSTLGSPADFVCWVIGENEEALPHGWTPLRVEKGFQKEDSVVTVMAVYPPVENMDHWSASVEEHMRWWGAIVSPLQNMGGPPIPQIMEQSPLVLVGPEHASLIASAGWEKDDFRKAFWEKTMAPLSAWPEACRSQWLAHMAGSVSDPTLVPITGEPMRIIVAVSGGDGKQSHYFAPLPGAFPISGLVGR
jgi:hypothetical protein